MSFGETRGENSLQRKYMLYTYDVMYNCTPTYHKYLSKVTRHYFHPYCIIKHLARETVSLLAAGSCEEGTELFGVCYVCLMGKHIVNGLFGVHCICLMERHFVNGLLVHCHSPCIKQHYEEEACTYLPCTHELLTA